MRMTTMLLFCALPALAAPAPLLAADPPGQAAAKGNGLEIPAPPAGMGQVVFYRSSMMGALISCKVHEGTKVVNHLSPGKYFVFPTTPGVHEFMVRSEAKDVIRVEVEEGETQFVRCSIGMGIGLGRPNLSPENRDDFNKRGKHLKLLPPYEESQDHH